MLLNVTPAATVRAPRGRVLISIAVAGLALTGGVGGFWLLASLKQPPAAREHIEKTYNVEVFVVEPCRLQEIFSGFGTARADREVVLSAQVAGEVVEVHPRLKVGEWVRAAEVRVGPDGRSIREAGDVLVRIDPLPYQERVAQARSLLAEDETELSRLQTEQANNDKLLAQAREELKTFAEEYERIRELAASNAASKSQVARALLEFRVYERAVLQRQNEQLLFPLRIEQAQRRRETHRAELQLAELDLARTEVRPPFAGSLSEVAVEVGQYVRSGDRLVRLTDPAIVQVAVPISLPDFARLEPLLRSGRQPAVELAENETAPPRWTGRLVRAAPEADQLTRTIQVFIEVENERQPSPLLPGTFVQARIEGPILSPSVVVPRDAILGGRLFLAKDGRAVEYVPTVTRTLQSLALLDPQEQEHVLQPGDHVILTNLDILFHGAKIAEPTVRTLQDELSRQRTPLVRRLPLLPHSPSG